MRILYLNYQSNNTSWLLKVLMATCAALSLSGCQHLSGQKTDEINTKPNNVSQTIGARRLGNNVTRGPRIYREGLNSQESDISNNAVVQASQVGRVPSIGQSSFGNISEDASSSPRSRIKSVEAFVTPLPLPQFLDVVYGEMLKVPYVADKDVAAMSEVISLRSSGTMKSRDFQMLVELALEEYGVRVVPEDGTYKIIQDKNLRSRIPTFIKSRARARTRVDLRPIVQFVELQAVSASSLVPLLKETFGKRNEKLRITANQQNNYVVLSGLPEDVNGALDVINELDELEFANTDVQRYTPKYWNAAEFSQELARALRIEGWEVSETANLFRAITLMPVEYSNDVFVFVKSETARRRVARWISDLDRPVQGGDTEQVFIYQVQNVDASILAQTANSTIASQSSFGDTTSVIAGPGSAQSPLGALGAVGNSFTVDPIGNRIIFTGTANQYDKMIGLLQQLDTPAPEVLIEVQIAEVTLTDESTLGTDFFIDDLGNNSFTGTLSTQGGVGLGSSGLNIGLLTGNVEAAINAFASNRRVKLLSKPILSARSGVEAALSVGQEVPVITSQRAANNQNGTGATDILQSIDYRSTGVLLTLTPIVFSDNRIDLMISQEVSSAVSVPNSPIASPTISNRNILTQLSLEDGQTAVLGGLIQESITREDQGVPFLKDIPGLGKVFSNEGISKDTTELVVLITAYVLRGQADRQQFVNRLSSRIDSALEDDGRLYTLEPKGF